MKFKKIIINFSFKIMTFSFFACDLIKNNFINDKSLDTNYETNNRKE